MVRHARAKNCEIALGADDNATVLQVSDDGVGLSGNEGNGLTGLRERVAAAGAELHVSVAASGGTLVEVMQREVTQ